MIEVLETETFTAWLNALRDRSARTRIQARLLRLQVGLFGDARPVGEGVSELRTHHGPGYRVNFVRHGGTVVLLLCGGDKSTQARDVAEAKALARTE